MAEELEPTTYQVEVLVEIKIAGDEEAAYAAVDTIMQRAWDTDDGRKWAQPKWHFEMLEDCVTAVANITGDEVTKPEDQAAQTSVEEPS